MTTGEKKKLLELHKLKKYFQIAKGVNLKAVEDVSFTIYEGEKFGVVGESGCGKSTLGRTILQLETPTSGAAIYYGKSIQELNPAYIQKEINHLKEYQKKAGEYYQKSLGLDEKAAQLEEKASQLAPDQSSRDARSYDDLNRQIARLQFASRELRKDASRQLREGSRTVGSLILCRDIDAIASLFTKAEQEVSSAHAALEEYSQLKSEYDANAVLIDQIDHTEEHIAALEKKTNRSDEENYRLADLYHIRRKIAKADRSQCAARMEALAPQMEAARQEAETHHRQEMAYRQEAFDTYHGKDILPLTERTQDPAYQAKLDGNYETGINLSKLTPGELRAIRPDLQMVFQDPAASLDPRQTVGSAIEEVFRIHTNLSKDVRRERTLQLLKEVDLKEEHYYSYPHSLSGGMKQRVDIARAIALDPSFVVLDEAVSALDVSVQAQILQLLNHLQQEKHLTYLFITHDLGVVKHFCDRVLVMYLGNVCELADSADLFHHPLHPYTQSLLDAVPRMHLESEKEDEHVLQGEVPSPIHVPSGCPFHTRCPKCMKICEREKPVYQEVEPHHFAACHLYDKEKEDAGHV